MAYNYICEICGARLDPSEKCDCEKKPHDKNKDERIEKEIEKAVKR